MKTKQSHERPQKILVAMLGLSDGTTRFLKYEDIVVKAFEMFPDEFALRGHPQFPDSSDIHKPLYSVLKRKGLVRSAHKSFALTALGISLAQQLAQVAGNHLSAKRDPNRMPRDAEVEMDRMTRSEAFRLFSTGQSERMLDTDFYGFLGCTVRTSPNDFFGRVTTIESALALGRKLSHPDRNTADELANTWKFLANRFRDLIERKAGNDGHRKKNGAGRKGRHPARAQQV